MLLLSKMPLLLLAVKISVIVKRIEEVVVGEPQVMAENIPNLHSLS